MSTKKTSEAVQGNLQFKNFTELTGKELGGIVLARQSGQRGGEETLRIPISKIFIREGFNGRSDFGDIEGLAKSMMENGQMVPGRVDILEDGTFLLVAGERRYRALMLVWEWTKDEPMYKAIVNGSKTTEEQRLLQMFTENDGKPFLPHEAANIIKRLINIGYSQTEVAKKIGKSDSYVSQMLDFFNEDKPVRDLVESGSLAMSTLTQMKKQIPDKGERTNVIMDAARRNIKNPDKKEFIPAIDQDTTSKNDEYLSAEGNPLKPLPVKKDKKEPKVKTKITTKDMVDLKEKKADQILKAIQKIVDIPEDTINDVRRTIKNNL